MDVVFTVRVKSNELHAWIAALHSSIKDSPTMTIGEFCASANVSSNHLKSLVNKTYDSISMDTLVRLSTQAAAEGFDPFPMQNLVS